MPNASGGTIRGKYKHHKMLQRRAAFLPALLMWDGLP